MVKKQIDIKEGSVGVVPGKKVSYETPMREISHQKHENKS